MHDLQNIPTTAPKELDKKETKEQTEVLLEELAELQNLLYASGTHSVLVVLQGMDASGKDGVVKKVFGAVNPMGLSITSFKAPTEEELKHDFLWRIHKAAPAKGVMGIFNRSHYEDVLITRVKGWCDDAKAVERFEAINAFEQLLQLHNNTVIFKFYLHVSEEEQAQRLQERTEDPAKHWKYNPNDLKEAKYWPEYRRMYEEMFVHCSVVPWTIVPADQNWYKEYLIAKTVTDGLRALNLRYPQLKEEKKA